MSALFSRRVFALASTAGLAVFLREVAQAATFNYKYGHNLPIESPLHLRSTEMWHAIERETNGRLSVKVYPNSVLGGDIAMLSQLREGALEFMTIGGPILSPVVPVSAIENIPFAFKTARQAYAAVDGELGAFVRSEIEAKGIHAFEHPFEIGFYQITNSVRPIRTVADLAGIKMRTGTSKLGVDTFRSLGASPIPLGLADVYTALQTHIADGQYNPYATIEVNKYFEVQRYLSEANFAWGNYWFLGNRDAWNALGSEIQGIVEKNVRHYVALQRRDTELFSAASADKLQRQGMVRNVCDATTFRAKLTAEGFYSRWRAEFGARPWALLEEYAGKLT